MPAFPPKDARLETIFKPSGPLSQKWGREKLVQGHFMAKILFLHQISCRVNHERNCLSNRNWGDELCLAGKELSKGLNDSLSFPKS
jgi:hypothetical protein